MRQQEETAERENEPNTDTKEQPLERTVRRVNMLALVQEVLHQWVLVVAAVVLMALVCGICSALVLTPTYQSTSSLYVLSKSSATASLTDLKASTNLANDYIEVIKSRPVLELVISNLGLDETYSDLYKKVSVSSDSDSRIVEITVSDDDPVRAMNLANELAEISSAFIAYRMDQDPPSMIESGYANYQPVAPKVGRNTVLGALVGCVAAVAVIVMHAMLRDGIMSPDDLQENLHLPVLASLPYEEASDDKSKGMTKKKLRAAQAQV